VGCDNIKTYGLESKDKRKDYGDHADDQIDDDCGKRRVAKNRQE